MEVQFARKTADKLLLKEENIGGHNATPKVPLRTVRSKRLRTGKFKGRKRYPTFKANQLATLTSADKPQQGDDHASPHALYLQTRKRRSNALRSLQRAEFSP